MRDAKELTSQKMRKVAPELDPLRLGTGWKLEDLSKPQIIVERPSATAIPALAIWISLSRPPAAASRTLADTARATTPPTSATARARARTASISVSPAAR